MLRGGNTQVLIQTVGVTTASIIVINLVVKKIKQHNAEKSKIAPFADIPMLPNSHPIFGHVLAETVSERVEDIPSYSLQLLKKHSLRGLSSLWYGTFPILVIFDPIAAASILQATHFRAVPKIVFKHISMLTSTKNLIILNGREWRLYRSAIHKAMTNACLKGYHQTMVDCTYNLTHALKIKIKKSGSESMYNDILPLMKMITFDIFFLVSIGMELQSCEKLETCGIAQNFDLLQQDFLRRLFTNPYRPWNIFYWIPTFGNIKRYRRSAYLRAEIGNNIFQRREEWKRSQQAGTNNGDTKRNADLLTNIFDAEEKITNKDEKLNLTDSGYFGLVTTLLVAGSETTSTTLTYALYLVAKHPEIEQFLLHEINDVMDSDNDWDVESLVYCRAVIQETLRLFPAAYNTTRSIPEHQSIDINGIKVQGPATLHIPIWVIHRDENNFPRPTEFLPERWVRKIASSKWWTERSTDVDSEELFAGVGKHEPSVPSANRKAFFAFSAGARSCVGSKFAYQEAIIVLAILIKELKFEVDQSYVCTPVRVGLTQAPKDGIPMTITPRV